MKRFAAVCLAVCMVLSLFACGAGTATYTACVMENAWTGEFSDARFKKAIQSYEKHCEPMQVTTYEEAGRVELAVGSIDSYEIVRVASDVDIIPPAEELQEYVDLWIPAEYDAESGCLLLDLTTCYSNSITWGYLIKITRDDTDTWYYFRVLFIDDGTLVKLHPEIDPIERPEDVSNPVFLADDENFQACLLSQNTNSERTEWSLYLHNLSDHAVVIGMDQVEGDGIMWPVDFSICMDPGQEANESVWFYYDTLALEEYSPAEISGILYSSVDPAESGIPETMSISTFTAPGPGNGGEQPYTAGSNDLLLLDNDAAYLAVTGWERTDGQLRVSVYVENRTGSTIEAELSDIAVNGRKVSYPSYPGDIITVASGCRAYAYVDWDVSASDITELTGHLAITDIHTEDCIKESLAGGELSLYNENLVTELLSTDFSAGHTGSSS